MMESNGGKKCNNIFFFITLFKQLENMNMTFGRSSKDGKEWERFLFQGSWIDGRTDMNLLGSILVNTQKNIIWYIYKHSVSGRAIR